RSPTSPRTPCAWKAKRRRPCSAWWRRWRISTTFRPSTRTTTSPTRSSRPSRLHSVALRRCLGIDPGLVATGYGLLEASGARPAVLVTGVITTTTDLAFEARVRLVYDGIHDVLVKHMP